LFGFQLIRDEPDPLIEKAITLPVQDDGAVNIQTGSYYGVYVDLDGIVRNEIELITRYRSMSMQPEMTKAIDEIVNEAIATDDKGNLVELNCDDIGQPIAVQQAIRDEFDYILKLLDFGNRGHDVFRRWYIDGRLNFHLMISEAQPELGIQEVRYIDPRRIRKIREIHKQKDPATGIDLITKQNEYYLYNEKGMIGAHSNLGARIAVNSIVNVNSGIMDEKNTMVLSHLHASIKPLNILNMVEDAAAIYRISRAAERRVFYIDVGNMPTIKADQYLKDLATKYRNKLVFDSRTGETKDDRRHMSMLEDFWIPRREGQKASEIKTLEAGSLTNAMADVDYFKTKLYESVKVPIGRLVPSEGFSLGRSTEITRDELNFSKFVDRLRNKFATLFDELMRVQLVLKRICTEAEWDDFKEKIWYDFQKDNDFNELKEAELWTNRFNLLTMVAPFVGTYVSQEWAKKNILRFSEEDIIEIAGQINDEAMMGMANMGIMGPGGVPMFAPTDANKVTGAAPAGPAGGAAPANPILPAISAPSGPAGMNEEEEEELTRIKPKTHARTRTRSK
jgi:hypothetical protein